MIQRIITALVLIPLVLLLILRAPIWLLAIVAGIVALLAVREFLELTRRYGVEPFTVATYVYAAVFVLASAARFKSWNNFDYTNLFFIISVALFATLAPFVFLTLGMRREKLGSVYPASAASVFAFAYIAIPLGMLVNMRQQTTSSSFFLVYLMLVVWSGDIFAYFAGKAVGRHKMAPRISPKKTWEGAAASMLASVGIGTCFYHYAVPVNRWLIDAHLLQQGFEWDQRVSATWTILLLSAVVNIAAQLGDLVESAIKRGADVKDSGSILPGHGGMLDRIDAILFAAPVLWVYALWHVLP